MYFTASFQTAGEEIEEIEVRLPVRFTVFPEFDGNKLSAVGKIRDEEKIQIIYYIQSEAEKESLAGEIQAGTVCRITGTLASPRSPGNPGVFNYKQFLLTQKIKYILTVQKVTDCRNEKNNLHAQILSMRKSGIELVEKHFPAPAAPFINALLFGYDEKMDEEKTAAYQQQGISHLLAISGLHVTIVTACIYFLLLRCGLTREQVRILLLMFLPVYAILSGAGPSVIRAVFMSWLILFFSKWKEKFHPLDALSVSFLVYILVNPFIIFHVGFQLSYSVAGGLILSRTIFRKIKNALLNSFMVSFISQLLSLPILLFHFYEFSLLSFLLNVVYVPLYSVIILPLSLAIFPVLFILPEIARPGISLLTFLLTLANDFAVWINQFRVFKIVLGKPSVLLLLLYYAAFFTGFYLIEKYWLQKKKALILLFTVPLLFHILTVKYTPAAEVTFIDVGQGDSILIKLPFNRGTYLIDTGGKALFAEEAWKKRKNYFDPGKHIIAPFLKSKGVTKIDKLILTHGDMDHVGSAVSILDQIHVKEVVVGKTINKKNAELEVIKHAKRKNIRVIEVYAGMYWKKDGHWFYIISPEKFAGADNDSSVVVYAKMGGKKWLFTGDLEERGEKRLINNYPELTADILKVGHHGSITSTTEQFLEKIHPDFAVISAGKNNRYGHPHEEVLDRLQKFNVIIFRTDENGAVSFTYCTGRWRVKTIFP